MYCLKRTIAISLLAVASSLSSPAFSQSMEADNTSMVWFLGQPTVDSIVVNGNQVKYLTQFNRKLAENKFGWTSGFQIMRPGLYQFLLDPKETKRGNVAQAKTIMVPVYGQDGGLFKLDKGQNGIVPLTTPFGEASGKVFSGQVLSNGKPAANTVVAVEFYGAQNYQQAPATTKIVNLIRTNDKGVFSFPIPWEGWWGFAVLNDGNSLPMKNDESSMQVGSVLWTKFVKP